MRAYAPRFDGDVELWGLTGLLHDLDYERYPNLEDGHPRYALRELEARGYPPELVRAVASHADFLGVSRDSPMEKCAVRGGRAVRVRLAVAYVRPERLQGMTPKSVKKKLKQPSFAAAVNREELRHGAEELGVDFDEHLDDRDRRPGGEAGRAGARRGVIRLSARSRLSSYSAKLETTPSVSSSLASSIAWRTGPSPQITASEREWRDSRRCRFSSVCRPSESMNPASLRSITTSP